MSAGIFMKICVSVSVIGLVMFSIAKAGDTPGRTPDWVPFVGVPGALMTLVGGVALILTLVWAA